MIRFRAGALLLGALLIAGCGGDDGFADDDLAKSMLLPTASFPDPSSGWDTEEGADQGVLGICAYGSPPGLTGHAGPQGYVRDRDRLTEEVAAFDSPSAARAALAGLDERVQCLIEGFESGDFDNDAGRYAKIQVEPIPFNSGVDGAEGRRLTVEFTTRTSAVTVPVTFDVVYMSRNRVVLVLMSASPEASFDMAEFEAIANVAATRATAMLDTAATSE